MERCVERGDVSSFTKILLLITIVYHLRRKVLTTSIVLSRPLLSKCKAIFIINFHRWYRWTARDRVSCRYIRSMLPNSRRTIVSISTLTVLEDLYASLRRTNPYIAGLKTCEQRIREQPAPNDARVRLVMQDPRRHDPRTYNRPTSDEVAVVIVGNPDEAGWRS